MTLPDGSVLAPAVEAVPALPSEAAVPPLNPAEMTTWRSFLIAHAGIMRVLGAELERGQDMPLSWYDVFVQLSEAPGRQLRMSELADAVLLSRSGLTRLVDRLEKEGLVERQACPQDARGTLAVLTPAGMDRLRQAAPVHLVGVREHFIGKFDEAELQSLAALLGRLSH